MSRRLHQDAQALRDYVTAMDERQYELLPEGVVAVTVSHSNLAAKHIDIRLDLHLSVQQVKERLHKHCGTPAASQRLFRTEDGKMLYELEDHRMLGYYGIESGMMLHIVDTDPFSISRNGGLEDVSLVQKYVMSEEDYDRREGTLRAWIKEQRAADPNFKLKPKSGPGAAGNDAPVDPATIPGPESVEHVTFGARCEVMPGARRGTVVFVGEVPGLSAGYWVGVRLDEPLGKSNGTVKGVEYFECPLNYGTFVRGHNVTIGDYPIAGLDDDEDEDNEIEGGENKAAETAAFPAAAASSSSGASSAPSQQQQQQQQQPHASSQSTSTADRVLSSTTKAMLARARIDADDDDDEDEI